MSQKIVHLTEDVINKIAAGEVIENPAAIAKELIENSLDAGAQTIKIFIEEGGMSSLKIEDDGWGMDQEDARLSLERHATSKIRTENDLFALTTMGFRGEALAAIAAVSHFEMRTSEGQGIGTRIAAEGGKITTIEPCARNRGTSVWVRDLFFNVPARKKFLKSAAANRSAVMRVVEIAALAHPEISFSLESDGKIILELESQEQKKRIAALLNPMPHEILGCGIWGLLASPEEANAQRRSQYLFINKRAVFSPLIAKAVKAGLGTRIDEARFPSFILFLELAPDLVDVNVHPQKKEVRFADEKKIFRKVEHAVASALQPPALVFSRSLSFAAAPFSFTEELPTQTQKPAPSPSFDFSFALRPLAILDGLFLLQAEELLLIDLKKAHARVLYESIKKGPTAAQALMWPIEVSVKDEQIVDELQSMGIECRWIGKKTIAIDALPSLLQPEDFFDFLDAWSIGKKLDMAVCRYASSTKKKFAPDEACLLWKKLLQCSDSLYDPLGRRIWKNVNIEQLKKILEDS
ncbi:MAG TPA: DNA mismatch repair endonuclease MutL [Chlamydiales bacterium]|nr:DNA mismatch repair endonuclease MutL [Chlamydiales bacterium]